MKKKVTIITSLYHCEQFLEKFFFYVERIENKEDIVFLLLHNVPTNDELTIINQHIEGKEYYKHVIIEILEPLYSTWNRGIDLADTPYVGIWNVDDIRLQDSIILQQEALDNDPSAGISFGDIWGTKSQEEIPAVLYQHPRFNDAPKEYNSRFMIGCFPMWRKKINNEVVYFEEQFRLVSDFDFQIRMAQISFIQKVEKPSGYYLDDASHKLSSNSDLQALEQTALHLRYANYHLVNLVYIVPAICRYKIYKIKNRDQWVPVSSFFRFHRIYSLKRLPLFMIALLKFPKDLARYIWHKIR